MNSESTLRGKGGEQEREKVDGHWNILQQLHLNGKLRGLIGVSFGKAQEDRESEGERERKWSTFIITHFIRECFPPVLVLPQLAVLKEGKRSTDVGKSISFTIPFHRPSLLIGYATDKNISEQLGTI